MSCKCKCSVWLFPLNGKEEGWKRKNEVKRERTTKMMEKDQKMMEDQNFYCDFCKPCVKLILEYEEEENEEDSIQLESSLIQVKVQDLDVLYAYLQTWVNKSCPCIFRRTQNVDKFCALIKKIMLFTVQMLKRLGKTLISSVFQMTLHVS